MACRTWSSGLLQREDPIPDGGSWTTDAGTAYTGQRIDFRCRLIGLNDGTGCTSYTHFQYRKDGGAWTEVMYDKFQEVQFQFAQPIDWFYPYRTNTTAGTYEFRCWCEYDGADYYTNTVTITVSTSIAWTEAETAGSTATETATAGSTTVEVETAGTTAVEVEAGGTTAVESEPLGAGFAETVPVGGTWSETESTAGAFAESEPGGDSWGEVETAGDGWSETETVGVTMTETETGSGSWTEEESNGDH